MKYVKPDYEKIEEKESVAFVAPNIVIIGVSIIVVCTTIQGCD
jgi:hypothetical protein